MIKNSDIILWDHYQTIEADKLSRGHSRQDVLFRIILSRVKPQSRILEIGFGDCYLLRKLSAVYQCFGADISPKNIKQQKAQQTAIKFNLVGIDGKLPYKNAYFDCFIASEVLEHMGNAQLSKTVKEIHRVLKPNGLAVITVPAGEDLTDNTCFCPNCGHSFHRWGHEQSFCLQKVYKIFQSFNQIKIYKIPNVQGHINLVEDFKYLIRKILIKFFPNNIIGNFLIFINK